MFTADADAVHNASDTLLAALFAAYQTINTTELLDSELVATVVDSMAAAYRKTNATAIVSTVTESYAAASAWSLFDCAPDLQATTACSGLEMTHRLELLVAGLLLLPCLAWCCYRAWDPTTDDERPMSPFQRFRSRLNMVGRLARLMRRSNKDTLGLSVEAISRAKALPKKRQPSGANGGDYQQLVDETEAAWPTFSKQTTRDNLNAEEERGDTAMLRPLCDMLLLWPKELPDGAAADEVERRRLLSLIKERLFVVRLDFEQKAWLTCSSKAYTIYQLSTQPSRDSTADKLKARRVMRLLSRLASVDRMPKRLRLQAWLDTTDADEASPDRLIWRSIGHPPGLWAKEGAPQPWFEDGSLSASNEWVDGDQRVVPGAPVAPNVSMPLRRIFPFDERMQPFVDPCPDVDVNGERTDGVRMKHLVFEPAPRDEWVEGRVELFTSRERIHLMHRVLTEPVHLGGCGANLERACERGWFTVVPVHDGNRTTTRWYQDSDHARAPHAESDVEGAPAPSAALAADASSAPTTMFGRARRATGEALGRVRRATLAWVRQTVEDASVRRVRKRIEDVTEGTLIRRWYKQPLSIVPKQPLDDVRDYFGVEIALYFAFLEHLIRWMAFLGPFGILPMIGWVYFGRMDNPLASIYSLIAPISSFLLAKYWRQRSRELAYRWNTEMADTEQAERYQFREADGEGWSGRRNEGAGGFYSEHDYYVSLDGTHGGDERFDREKRVGRVTLSALFVIGFMLLSFYMMILVQSLRVVLMTLAAETPAAKWPFEWMWAVRVSISSQLGTLPSVGWTLLSNQIGKALAQRLTDFERWRKPKHHEIALLLKKFAIIFVNSYAGLLYIAFLKATPAGALLGPIFRWFEPLEDLLEYALGLEGRPRQMLTRDYCHDMANFTRSHESILAANGGVNPYCMGELSFFLASTVGIAGFLSLVTAPLLIAGYRLNDMLAGFSGTRRRFYERQAQLEPWRGCTDELVDLVIQIGYAVLFAPAFPITALVVWLVNVLKQRADVYVLLKLTRRPLSRRVTELFGLQYMLHSVSIVAVLTNTGLLFFTATQLTTLLHAMPSFIRSIPLFGLFVLTEHLMFLVSYAITTCLLDETPELSKLRAWSDRFEPQWLERCRTTMKPHEGKLKKLGPFKIVPVPEATYVSEEAPPTTAIASFFKNRARRKHARAPGANASRAHATKGNAMGFQIKEGEWSIDQQQSWLLSDVLGTEMERLQQAAGNGHAAANGPRRDASQQNRARTSSKDATASEAEDGLPVAARGERRAFGRVSPRKAVSLSAHLKKRLGIPESARHFAWLYPLTRFADDRREGGTELNINLELELHDAIAREHERGLAQPSRRCAYGHQPVIAAEPGCFACREVLRDCFLLCENDHLLTRPDHSCKKCQRELALRFLGVGGYAYFEESGDGESTKIALLSTLRPDSLHQQNDDTLGASPALLEFCEHRVPRAKGDILPSHLEAQREAAHKALIARIGGKLRQRGEFCPPTLPFLKVNSGVAGFCWITPNESFPGAVRLTPFQEKAVQKVREKAPLYDLTGGHLEEHAEDRAEKYAKKHWPLGAFCYMFCQGKHRKDSGNVEDKDFVYRIFVVKGKPVSSEQVRATIEKMQSRWRPRYKMKMRAVLVMQRHWRGHLARLLNANAKLL